MTETPQRPCGVVSCLYFQSLQVVAGHGGEGFPRKATLLFAQWGLLSSSCVTSQRHLRKKNFWPVWGLKVAVKATSKVASLGESSCVKSLWLYLFTMCWVRVLEMCLGKVSAQVMERACFPQGTSDGVQLLARDLLGWEPSQPLSCLRSPGLLFFGAWKGLGWEQGQGTETLLSKLRSWRRKMGGGRRQGNMSKAQSEGRKRLKGSSYTSPAPRHKLH